MKATKQKEAILAAVCTMRTHPTADEIYDKLRKDFPHISLGTVYRNLNSFAEKGDIRKVVVPDGSDRFDFRLDSHEHICCEKCGKVFDCDVHINLDEIVPKENDVVLTGYKLMLYGVCRRCGAEKGV